MRRLCVTWLSSFRLCSSQPLLSLCTVSLYRLLLQFCVQFVLRRPTWQVPLLLLNISFSPVRFILFLFQVPSTYSSFSSQSVFFIYFYTPRFSLLRFLFKTSFPFIPLSLFLTPLSNFLYFVLSFTLYIFPTSAVTSVLAFTYRILRCCATNRKVPGSIPDGVSGFFIDIKSFRSHYGLRVETASNRNEYQEYLLEVNVAGA